MGLILEQKPDFSSHICQVYSVPSRKLVAGMISHFPICKLIRLGTFSKTSAVVSTELISVEVAGQTFHLKKILRSCLASIRTEAPIQETNTL